MLGGCMNVGTDNDGRPITYDEATRSFAIGGIATTIDRLVAYDRGGQVTWASDEIRSWALEFERMRQEHAAQVAAAREAQASDEAAARERAAKRVRLTAQGYSPDSVVRFAGGMKAFSTTLVVILVVGGVFEGLFFGALVRRWIPGAILVAPILLGATGFLIGYLATLLFKVSADLLLTGVQIEMNTRTPE